MIIMELFTNSGNNGVGNKLTANNQNQNPETAKKKKLNFYDNNSLLRLVLIVLR